MADIFDAIKENAARAAARAEQEAAELKIKQAAAQEARKREALKKRKDATVAWATRVIAAAVLGVVLVLFEAFGLVNTDLTVCLICAVFVWMAFWTGAWVQFRWCRGGLLK